MASPPPGSTTSSTHRCGRYLICPACTRISRGGGGVSTDTSSSQAQCVSRTALDTGREGQLLRPVRAPPSPGHAAQPASQGSTAAQLSSCSISAGNEVQARVRPAGRGGIPRQPSSPGGPPPRAAYFGAHGRSVARPRSCWSQRKATTAAPNRPARSTPLGAQRGEPAASAVLTSSGAAWGVCCLPSGPPKSRASRSVPTFPCAAHTHISAEHKSTRRSPQRRPGGTAPAASRRTW